MAEQLTITLTNRKLEQLHAVYTDVVDNWQPDDNWEQLLYDHAKELLRELTIKLAKEVKAPRLVLSLPQARAMWMMWQLVELTGSSISLKVAVDEVVADVDKHVQHPDNRLKKSFKKSF